MSSPHPSAPSPPYTQRFFPTYAEEYAYTLRIIKIAQSASRTRPHIFTRLTHILSAAVADPSRGLVSTLPELASLFNDAGLGHVFERCMEYARLVSDVPAVEKKEGEEKEDTARIRAKMGLGEILAAEPKRWEEEERPKKRQRGSGVLPQRKSVRQWNKRPSGDTTVVEEGGEENTGAGLG